MNVIVVTPVRLLAESLVACLTGHAGIQRLETACDIAAAGRLLTRIGVDANDNQLGMLPQQRARKLFIAGEGTHQHDE